MSKEAMRLALEAAEVLEKLFKQAEAMHKGLFPGVNIDCQISVNDLRKGLYAAPALREALAEQPAIKQDLTPEQQAQQEPVAWLVDNGGDAILIRHYQNFPGVFAGSEFNKRPLVFGDISPQAQPQQEPVAWPIDGDTARRIADKICVSYETVQQVARELVAMQPAQQEPVARLQVFMESFDMGQSLAPNTEYKFASASACQAAKMLPLGNYDLYTSPPAQRKPLTHEQRVDLLARFEPHKHEWHAPAILIDMVEAAHGIKENT